MRSTLCFLLLQPACSGSGATHRELFVKAQQAGLDAREAQALCERIEPPSERDACLLELARSRADLGAEVCDAVAENTLGADCWFLLAEHRAGTGDRWGALRACGRAGPYQAECQYHAWTRELQAIARGPHDLHEALVLADDPTAYCGALETAGTAQPQRVWGDFWYFWWLHHPPADPAACLALDTERRLGCEAGTLLFVERSLDMALRNRSRGEDLLDRSCRAGSPPDFLLDARAVDSAAVRDAGDRALARLCEQGVDAVRPWNPVFQPRRVR